MTKKRTSLLLAAVVAAAGVSLFVMSRGIDDGSPDKSEWVRRTAGFEKYLEIDGNRIRVLDTGEGIPVMLLHGWADSTFTWREIIPRLSKRFRVIAHDCPGFGYSDKPEKALSYAEQAAVAVKVLDRLGVRRAFAAGNSMGGGAVLHMAADFPARLYGVIPIDSAVDRERPGLLNRLLLSKGSGEVGIFLMGPMMFRRTLSRMVTNDALLTDGVIREMYLPVTTPGGRRSMLEQYRQNARVQPRFEMAARITVPTLIIWGRDDTLIPLPLGDKLNRSIEGSRLVILDDTGHLPQWEAPATTARLIEEFIDELTAGRTASAAMKRDTASTWKAQSNRALDSDRSKL
jgi:pimeloyl-ACP methyl ester carboxylesterase